MKAYSRARPALRLRPELVALAATVTFLTAGCGDDPVTPDPSERRLVLLYTSDEHSHMLAFSPELDDFPMAVTPGDGSLRGGVARRATVLGGERDAAASAGKDTLTVSAGDNQFGSLPQVAFESDSIDYVSMARLGYDVTTFGNHEFDLGPAALSRSISAAKEQGLIPAIVASNIHFSAESAEDDALEAHYGQVPGDGAAVHRYQVITTPAGLRVGFIGYVGVNAEFVVKDKAPVRFSANGIAYSKEGDPELVLPRIYDDLRPTVDHLRKTEKVDLVVALAHAGILDTSTEESALQGEDALIAANVPGIDVIVSGHEHSADPRPIIVTSSGGAKTLILNAGSYGQQVGRVELVVSGDGQVSWDLDTQALLEVDDRTVPHPEHVGHVEAFLEKIEGSGVKDGRPYLERILRRATGGEVTDGGTGGDLYFYPLAKTAFDVVRPKPMTYLSADAMLAAMDELGVHTDLSIESDGVVRNNIKPGKTGVVSAADAFSVVPLGQSPLDGTQGYPLFRAHVSLLELRAIAEFSLSLGPVNNQFDLALAGARVEYDATRPLVESTADLFNEGKGQVMRILVDTDHSDGSEDFDEVVYDRESGIALSRLFSAVTSTYVGEFAAAVGASLKTADGADTTIVDSIVKYADGAEVKQVEAFMRYLYLSPGGTIPARYDAKSPQVTRRFVCVKGC